MALAGLKGCGEGERDREHSKALDPRGLDDDHHVSTPCAILTAV
jgi:hypothetical protein